MGPPFPPPLGSSLVLVFHVILVLWALILAWRFILQVSSNPRWPPPSHWLRGFGAKIESPSLIGPQVLAANHFQTRTRIGPWKMTKKKGGKMIFKPVPPLTLGKLVFHIFSARKIIDQVQGGYLRFLTRRPPFLTQKILCQFLRF